MKRESLGAIPTLRAAARDRGLPRRRGARGRAAPTRAARTTILTHALFLLSTRASPRDRRPTRPPLTHDDAQVLYLGAAAGTTVSHVSDIVGPEGNVYAVEFSHRPGRDLINMAKFRTNVRWPRAAPPTPTLLLLSRARRHRRTIVRPSRRRPPHASTFGSGFQTLFRRDGPGSLARAAGWRTLASHAPSYRSPHSQPPPPPLMTTCDGARRRNAVATASATVTCDGS